MPCKRAEKARKTRKVNSKEIRDSSTEIVKRNLRSVRLEAGSHSTSEAYDATEGPEIQHVENRDIYPALSTLEIDKNYIPSSTAVQMYNEDDETGNLNFALNCTDLARNSSNAKLVMECTQTLEGAGTLFKNEYSEDRNADGAYNIMRKGDEGDTIEYMNSDVSYNITGEREEDNTNEDMNVGVSQDDDNTIEDMNTDAPYITRKQEEGYATEDVDEKLYGDFPNQSDNCLKLQQDNVCEILKQKEHASSETTMPFSITADSNGANNMTANKVIHNDVENCIDRDPQTITAVTVKRFKSCSQAVILQSEYDKPMSQENTTKYIEDITSVFLSQTKQPHFESFGSIGNDTTQASTKSRFLKRKDKHLFSSQPQSKRFKSPRTMTTSDYCYNTTDSAPYQNKDVGTHTVSPIKDEGICDSVVIVDAETVHRNMDSEDMLPYSTSISQVKSCTGYTMEKRQRESASSVTKDEGNKILEEENLTTQCWYPHCDTVNEETTLPNLQHHYRVHQGLSLSDLKDHDMAKEELSFSDLSDHAKVDEELILPQHSDDAKVQENVNLVTQSEISEQDNAVKMNDSMQDIASRSEIRSDMHQNLVETADCENNQMLTSSPPLQILPDVMCDDLHKVKAENMTKLINSSLTNMEHSKKLNQNSVVINGEECTVEANDSEFALTCIEGSSVTESTRCINAVLDHPREATVFTDVQTDAFVNEPFNDITAGFSNSVMRCDKEKPTFTTAHEFIMNMSDLTMSKSHGNYMESVHNNEQEDLACMGTQEFTLNDVVINYFVSKEGIEIVQFTQSSMMTDFTKEVKLSKEESKNKVTVNLDCKLDPHLALSCGKMKGNNWETCQNGHFNKDDTFNGNRCADVNKLTKLDKEDTFNSNRCADVKLTKLDKEDTFNSNRCADVKLTKLDKEDTFNSNRCADVNKLPNSETVKGHEEKLYLEVPEMYVQGISNQIEGISSNKNVEGRVTVNSSLHTEAITAHSLQDVFHSTKYHLLPPHAQTACDKYQHRPQSDDRLDQDETHSESCSLIAENLTNQICSKEPHVLKQINDSIKECSTSSRCISSPLSSSHKTDAREIQLNRNSGCIQKRSLKLPVINKDSNQTTKDSQLGNSDCFKGVLTCADVFPNITGPDSSIAKQNAMPLDNKDCHVHLKYINANLCSDTKTTLSLLTSSKTDFNMETSMPEQRTLCLPSTRETYMGNCQEVFDNLDCYSLSDLQETSGKPSNLIFNTGNHKEDTQITAAAQSLSEHTGTSSQPSNCPCSVSQGIFCAPQSNYEDTKSSFLNKSVFGLNEMHKTLQKLSTMDSAIYLSDSQICQLASEDFEQAINSNEAENIDKAEDVPQDKFEQSFSLAQARFVREIEQKKAEGKKLVDAVITDLISVNKQLLRMKREMESMKRVVQQQNNKPQQSFHGKHEFGFHYQN